MSYFRLSLVFVVLLLAQIAPSDARLFPRTSRAIGRAASRVHNIAREHSARLSSDIYVALKAVLVSQPSPGGTFVHQRVYCIGTKPGSGGAGSSGNGGHHNGTSTSPSGPQSTTSPSPWTLVESHVSPLEVHNLLFAYESRKGLIFFRDGISSSEEILRAVRISLGHFLSSGLFWNTYSL
jgi:hypothetical protein